MAKTPTAVRTSLIRLWSANQDDRRAALDALYDMATTEMVDIRTAQPAVVVCLADPNPAIRRRAIEICEYRADLGADIGMAVPMLLTLRDDPDPETRQLVERALVFANQRLNGTLTACGIALKG